MTLTVKGGKSISYLSRCRKKHLIVFNIHSWFQNKNKANKPHNKLWEEDFLQWKRTTYNVIMNGKHRSICPCNYFLIFKYFIYFYLFCIFFIKKLFLVIQLQLYAFSPHPSTPPQYLNILKAQLRYNCCKINGTYLSCRRWQVFTYAYTSENHHYDNDN